MRRLFLMSILLGAVTVAGYADNADEVSVSKSTEDSITKDFDQDGKYSSYEKALRGAHKGGVCES